MTEWLVCFRIRHGPRRGQWSRGGYFSWKEGRSFLKELQEKGHQEAYMEPAPPLWKPEDTP